MDHSFIISRLYSGFSHHRDLWKSQREESQEFGAFVFFPGRELDWEWWILTEIRQYIQDWRA